MPTLATGATAFHVATLAVIRVALFDTAAPTARLTVPFDSCPPNPIDQPGPPIPFVSRKRF